MRTCLVLLALGIPCLATGLHGQATRPDAAPVHWHVIEKQVAGPGSERDRPSSVLWFGGGKIRYAYHGLVFIVDENEGVFIVINQRRKTYIRTSLPLDIKAICSEQLRLRFEGIRETGAVEEAGETTKILDRECQGYTVKLWQEYKGEKAGHKTGTVWATRDVPFDWKRLNRLLENLRVYYNRDARCRKELNKIQGFQMGWDMKSPRGETIMAQRIVKIARETPPPGTYAVPEGYTRREKLRNGDLG